MNDNSALGRVLVEKRLEFRTIAIIAALAVCFLVGGPFFLYESQFPGRHPKQKPEEMLLMAGVCFASAVALAILAWSQYLTVLRIREFGVSKTTLLGTTEMRYEDIDSFSYQETREFMGNSYSNTRYFAMFGSGKKTILLNISYRHDHDPDLGSVRDQISEFVAAKLSEQLDRAGSAPWTQSLRFARGGVEYLQKNKWQLIEFGRIGRCDFNNGYFFLRDNETGATLCHENAIVCNFYPGLTLLADRLSDKSLAPPVGRPKSDQITIKHSSGQYADQSSYAVRFEWGERGLDAISAGCKAIVIVDVCSFSTAVDIATARGAVILPYYWKDERARAYAKENNATLAGDMRTADAYSLSPSSLTNIVPGTRLVLSSHNGAVLCLQAVKRSMTIAACLRNAPAVAAFLREQGGPIAIIAGGERWPDDTLRPAWEDLIATGAIIAELPGSKSPEAAAAVAAFQAAKSNLAELLAKSSSGRELIQRGFAKDVELAAAYGVSQCVPVLKGEAFVAQSMANRALS